MDQKKGFTRRHFLRQAGTVLGAAAVPYVITSPAPGAAGGAPGKFRDGSL